MVLAVKSGEKIEYTSKEAIYESLILALLDEFNHIRVLLRRSQNERIKPQLWNNLFRCAETLKDLLENRPEQSDVDQWLEIIAEKAPKKFLKHAKEMIRSYRFSNNLEGIKFSEMTRKDA